MFLGFSNVLAEVWSLFSFFLKISMVSQVIKNTDFYLYFCFPLQALNKFFENVLQVRSFILLCDSFPFLLSYKVSLNVMANMHFYML